MQLSQLGAGYGNYTLPGADGIYGTADDTGTTFAGPDGLSAPLTISPRSATSRRRPMPSASGQTIAGLPQSLFIPNVTPDVGLSAPFNSLFTFFGQFFDHGLDLITKGGNGTVFIPLQPDDPLYVPGGPDQLHGADPRAAICPGPTACSAPPTTSIQHINTTSPFVDQNQTYTSHPSHQVFLRDYMIGADGKLHATGKLLSHHAGADGVVGTADDPKVTHGDLGRSEGPGRDFLGIKLTDADVGDVPLLATDPTATSSAARTACRSSSSICTDPTAHGGRMACWKAISPPRSPPTAQSTG